MEANGLVLNLKNIGALPKPTGPFAVGRISFSVTDPARTENGAPYKIPVLAWYPAQPQPGAPTAPYVNAKLDSAAAGIRTNTIEDAPLADGSPFPLVIFNAGYTSYIESASIQMEELASRGYVAISIGHIGEVACAVDGAFCPVTPEGVGPLYDEQMASIDQSMRYVMAPGVEAVQVLYPDLMAQYKVAVARTKVWATDTLLVLEALEQTPPALLNGALDLNRVGAFGMSFGGSTSVHLALTDPRIKAALSMDSMLYSDVYETPSKTPVFWINSGEGGAGLQPLWAFNNAEADAYCMTIKTSKHHDCCDLTMILEDEVVETEYQGQIYTVSKLGTIGGARMEALLNFYIPAFFDIYLKGLDRKAELVPLANDEIHFLVKQH